MTGPLDTALEGNRVRLHPVPLRDVRVEMVAVKPVPVLLAVPAVLVHSVGAQRCSVVVCVVFQRSLR